MKCVFISYSSSEFDKAEKVCQFLEDNDINCWIAPRDIDPGANYPTQIVSAIRNCDVFVLIASESANSSGHVSNEVSIAFDNKKTIIPFRIENVQFTDEFSYFLGRKHWIEAHMDFEKSLYALLRTIVPESKGVQVSSVEHPCDNFGYPDIIAGTRKFFRPNLKEFVDGCSEEFAKEYQYASNLFSLTTKVALKGKDLAPKEDLFDFLLTAIEDSSQDFILKIQGVTGGDKEVIMQYLFLNLYHKAIAEDLDILPIYINLDYFSKAKIEADFPMQPQFEKMIKQVLDPYISYCKNHPHSAPIIFVDGLRDYKSGNMLLDYAIEDILDEIENHRLIVGLEVDMTSNRMRIRKVVPLAGSGYEYVAEVSPIELLDKDKVQKCISLLEPQYSQIDVIVEKMRKMNFYTVDYYLLHLFADIVGEMNDDEDFTISDLYETYCLDFFRGRKGDLIEASRWAFDFACTDTELKDEEYFTEKVWSLIRTHSSFIDFLISYNYIQVIQKASDRENLSALEVILPKEVTRFATPRFNDSSSSEERLLRIVKENYSRLNSYGKSEMTYWLGRIKTPNLAEVATELLREYHHEIVSEIADKERLETYSLTERKNDFFLLRGIAVSLIYKGCRESSDEYIRSMIEDSFQNEINRGFHLEYYGDIAYVPTERTLNFADNLQVGRKTLERLSCSLEFAFAKSEIDLPTELILFTMCSLIQARLEIDPDRLSFNLEMYILRCIDFLDDFIEGSGRTSPDIVMFFRIMRDDFASYLKLPDKKNYFISNDSFNRYSEAKQVKRAGWVNVGIPEPENIVEHMYNSWLMTLLYLPDNVDGEGDYSKDSILKMLLIHDLGEAITGDIPRDEKRGSPQYDIEEDFVMRSLLVRGTYPQMPSLSEYYDLWDELKQQKTLNAKIAKDIDVLQAMYQFYRYYLEHPACFSEERKKKWMNEYKFLKTDIGKEIFRKLIETNNLFKDVER